MHTTTRNESEDQTQRTWDVAVDVSKDTLSWSAESVEGRARRALEEGVVINANTEIVVWLGRMLERAREHGFDTLRVVCEPTGGYEKRLLHLAREAGCATALASGEAVKQLQVVESNDTGKSDRKDPRTILMLVKLDKLLTDRPLHGQWLLLRELGIRYDRLERESARAKNRIHKLLVPLFGALSFKNDWVFDSRASAAVCALYGFDAAAIVAAGRDSFRSKLRRRGVYRSTIQRLWDDAQRSATAGADPTWLAMLAEDLRELFEDLARTRARRQAVRERMLALVDRLRERGEVRIVARPDLIGPFSLARILAETGPMRDFTDIRRLWRYGGLNLCPRQSGKKRGQDRQSKRGRSRLRHVLSQAVLKRVVKGALYGDYYHAKRASGMCSGKAMTAVARKFIKLLWGLERSGAAFDPKRVFASAGAVAAA